MHSDDPAFPFHGEPVSIIESCLARRGGSAFFRTLAAGLTGILMAGCVSLAPSFEQPPLPVASTYPGDAALSPPGSRAASLGWQDYFIDPVLRQLIAQALANNRDLRMALLRVEEARAAFQIQRADLFPSISIGADGSRGRVPGDLNLTGQSRVTSQYQANVGINAWELDFWGRIRNLNEAALNEYLASDAARRATQIMLVSQVANGYLILRELDERVAIARETIASRQESYRIFKLRNDVGSTSKLDLTQVETLLTQARSLGAQLEQARANQANALALLLGTPVETPLLQPAPLEDGEVMRPLRVGLPSDLLIDRPDILAAEFRLRAANANIGAARAAFFPRIALTGTYGSASAELDGLFDAGSRAWNFMPSVSLPIFDMGRRRANLELSEIRRDSAVADYERTIQAAFRDVADALSDRHWLDEQVRIQKETLATQHERARLAQLRYDNGTASYLEVLDAKRDLLEAEQQLVQTRRMLLSSKVSLYSALGGGSQTIETAPVYPYKARRR